MAETDGRRPHGGSRGGPSLGRVQNSRRAGTSARRSSSNSSHTSRGSYLTSLGGVARSGGVTSVGGRWGGWVSEPIRPPPPPFSFRRLTPEAAFLLPSLAAVTIAAGTTLARHLGGSPHAEPWLALFTTVNLRSVVLLVGWRLNARGGPAPASRLRGRHGRLTGPGHARDPRLRDDRARDRPRTRHRHAAVGVGLRLPAPGGRPDVPGDDLPESRRLGHRHHRDPNAELGGIQGAFSSWSSS